MSLTELGQGKKLKAHGLNEARWSSGKKKVKED